MRIRVNGRVGVSTTWREVARVSTVATLFALFSGVIIGVMPADATLTPLVLGVATTATNATVYSAPSDTCDVLVQVKGGNGGSGWTGSDDQGGSDSGGAGGAGGFVDSIVPANFGDDLGVTIGQSGTDGAIVGTPSAGGAGAGSGGTSGLDTYTNSVTAGGGGGSSEVTDNGTVIAVAGGGGGGATLADGISDESAGAVPGGDGGQGANTNGQSGGGVAADTFATGGTLSGVGIGGVFVAVPSFNFAGTNGDNGSGANGGNAGSGEDVAGGGGGAGNFGGGGGPGSGSGAGGSSYVVSGTLPDTLDSWTSPSSQAAGEVILTAVECANVTTTPTTTTTTTTTTTVPQAPSAPRDLVVTGGRGVISATWQAPASGANSYECKLVRRGAEVRVTTSTPNAGSSMGGCAFRGLKTAGTYGVSVNATNAVGSSNYVTKYAIARRKLTTIICIRGSDRRRVSGAPPRCPTGFHR